MDYSDQVYYSILPILIINVVIIVLFNYYGLTWGRRAKTPEVLSRLHKSFLGVFFREFWYWLTEPVVQFFKFLKLTPNIITGFAIILSVITGYLYFAGNIALAGWFLIISGSMDLFDGRLARATNRETKSGAFFDACVDRFSDGFVFAGLALYFVGPYMKLETSFMKVNPVDFIMLAVTILAIVGTEVMSYTKARGEAMGYTTRRGLMQRPERVASLSIISTLHPFFKIILERYGLHPDLVLMVLVVVLAVLVNFSAVVRLVAIFKNIKKDELNFS